MNDNFANRATDWDSPEKTKMTEIFVAEMLKHVKPQRSWKAMEIGAGTGLVGMQLIDRVKGVVFEDTSAAMLEVLKSKLTTSMQTEIVHGEIFDYTKQDIDLIFSCMAFHHIADIELTMNHLVSITNPNAIIVVGDLTTEDGSFHRFEPIPHKGFNTSLLSKLVENSGFEVLICKVYNTLLRERIDGVISNYDQFILIARKK
jgi:predicted TPR repeat methyltransferase